MTKATSKAKKVLIAEDEKPLARALSLKLDEEGIMSEIANDGDAVKEKVLQGGFDLILMDLMMPKHDGFSVMEDMKARKDTTPIIVMSNLSQDSDKDRATLAGAIHYFVKGDTPLSEIIDFVKNKLGL